MERSTKTRFEQLRDRARTWGLGKWESAEVFAEFEGLAADLADARRELALSRFREKTALRRGFYAGAAVDEYGNSEFLCWEDYEKHLAEEEEHAARLVRIAEAEENEK